LKNDVENMMKKTEAVLNRHELGNDGADDCKRGGNLQR